MMKNYTTLSSFSGTYLNNLKEKVLGKNPTQSKITGNPSKFLSLIIGFLFMTGTFSFAQTVTIGTGTTTTTNFPIYSCYNFNYSQQIYTAAQIGQAGTINKIRFYYDNAGTTLTNWNEWKVLFGHTLKTEFSSSTDWVPLASMTEVFNGTITPVAGNWFDLNFTTPFVYDGTSNIVVAVDENAAGYSCTAAFRSFTSGTNTVIYYYSDPTNPDPATPPTASSRSGSIAQMQVVFASSVAPGCAIAQLPADAATNVVLNPTLTWNEGAGGPTSYDVYFGTTTNPPLIGNQPGSSYAPVAPLNPNTTYYWKLVPVNAIGSATGCTESSFTTGTGFNYCVPTLAYGCSNGAQIGGFSTSSAITNISNLSTGCTSITANGYNDYSPTIQMAASQGTQFNIAVDVANYSGGVKVWIDYNQNGTFEPTELVAASAATITSGSTYSAVVNIPGTALLGTTRMRVRVVESSTTFGPCDSQNYGETEDYTIDIITPPSCMPPTALALSALTTNSATMSWTASTTGPTNGYDIYYGTSNTAPTAVSVPTVDNHPGSPYVAGSLTPATTYYWWVRADCGADQSLWSYGGSFYTSYCVPTGSTSYYLTNVSTTGGTQNFTNTTAAAPSGYADYSATIVASNFIPQTTSISLASSSTSTFIYSCWIDWNNDLDFADADETIFVSAYATNYVGTIAIPAGTPVGDYRMRVSTSWIGAISACGPATYGEYEDYTFSVVAQPTCMPPSAITAANITSTSADMSWTENGTASDWEIQYGLGSFVPTTGPSIAVTTNPYSLTNLQPSSTYRFYVRARCSPTDSSYWAGPYFLTTLCAPITALPWTENFDNLMTLGAVFPPCWVDENPGDWNTSNLALSTATAGPLSGPNYLRINWSSNATMWTPEFSLIAGKTYEFSLNWAGDGNAGWDGAVYVNSSATFTGATMLGTKFVESADVTTFNYQPEIFCFTPTTSGVYTFGTKVEVPTSAPNYLSFDNFGLKEVVTVPGTDGALSACQTGAPVDLNTVITTTVTDGSWNFNLNPSAVNSAGMLNANSVPSGVHQFYYISAGCAPDTTIATITIVQPSSAGNDGALAVCRNQPFNLLAGLTGSIDFGGVWTDPNSAVVPNGNTNASNIPGQYNYKYIVTNGVCPADTAKVVVNVQGCDYLGLNDVVFEGFSIHPNPTSEFVFIANTGSTEVFNYEVLDMNGRVILKANQAINGSTTTKLDLSKVEIGVYLIRVFNEQAEKTFRIVKN